MQINITGHQIDLGDSWRSYTTEKVADIAGKYFPNAVDANVKVSRSGELLKTEITVHPVAGAVVVSESVAGDAYASVDGALAKMNRQLGKYKNKLVGHKYSTVEMVDMAVIDAEEDKDAVGDAPVIIAEMQTELPLCTVATAVMRMDLAGLSAMMFRNTAHGGLNMVYRRADGNIGWIDPKNK
ncbi:MAG: ribosome-associated translation inhibitor RaiA [Alphaproteobacteria bacterium]|nr:ribosome-associated translation inhibitor RaiA [Alphaproteobacteria bacterium]